MRIYENSLTLISECFRDLNEMGLIVKPKSYQNKVIEGNEDFETKEIRNYVYTLLSLDKEEYLFIFEPSVKEWADEEFEERISYNFINPGKAWKMREKVWQEFLTEIGTFDYSYNGRIQPGGNLALIIKELSRNPDTRQAWLPIFHEKDVRYMGGTRRIPCSLGYHFMVRDGILHMDYIQRSADAVTHFGNDVYLAWKLMDHVALMSGYETGYLTHMIFSFHAYKKDWKKLSDGISKL